MYTIYSFMYAYCTDFVTTGSTKNHLAEKKDERCDVHKCVWWEVDMVEQYGLHDRIIT